MQVLHAGAHALGYSFRLLYYFTQKQDAIAVKYVTLNPLVRLLNHVISTQSCIYRQYQWQTGTAECDLLVFAFILLADMQTLKVTTIWPTQCEDTPVDLHICLMASKFHLFLCGTRTEVIGSKYAWTIKDCWMPQSVKGLVEGLPHGVLDLCVSIAC